VRYGGFGRREVVIRVNGFDTAWGAADLAAASAAAPNAVLVPKVSDCAGLLAYDAALAEAPATTRLWTMIETCAVVPELANLAALGSSTRLAAFVLGTNDLAKDMRAEIRPGRTPFLPVLTAAVCAARANGLIVIDGVCNEFRDPAVLAREAEQGREFGFDGKSLIHPDQIEPCNAVFSPNPAEIEKARAIVAAFEDPENSGKGAIRLEGRMVELLHLDQARRTLAIAAAIG
jgi:citrate lyase subunit beta/citryl-CoA lyase